jgi:hypothetical protein
VIINKTICSAGMNYFNDAVKIYSPEEIANDVLIWSKENQAAVLIALLHEKYSTNWNEAKIQIEKGFESGN